MRQSLEQEYIEHVSLSHRKKFAQFFTPKSVAELMCKWILGAGDLKNVLEPAFGLGIFSRILLETKPEIKIKGYDIDNYILSKAQEAFGDRKNVSLLLQDYMFNDWNNRYDGIVCNPPYFKFHDYDNKNVLSEVEQRIGCSLNGFTNLYTLFLLKSLHQLANNGRCAYIIPSEFMNSDYGILIKQQLVKSGMLRYIFVFDFEENIFSDALTTSCILLCANDKKRVKVCFQRIRSMADLQQIENSINSYPLKKHQGNLYNLADLKPNIKWKTYYKELNGVQFKNLVPFSNYAKVMRGIATGDNNFLLLMKVKRSCMG